MLKKKSCHALYKGAKRKKVLGKILLASSVSQNAKKSYLVSFLSLGFLKDLEFPVKDRKSIILGCLYGCLETGLCRALTCSMSCVVLMDDRR